jgi:dTMP kinase
MLRGRLITIEGLEGAGKSTSIDTIATQLNDHGVPFITTREPGGTDLGENVRKILLAHADIPMHAMTELLLMFAARVEHVDKVITPALEAGRWVICDRFTDSSYAYQGGGRGLALEDIATLESILLPDIKPDYTLMLDVPVEVGLARAGRHSSLDRFEQEEVAFFERARQVFLKRSEAHDRFYVIDAARAVASVQEDIAQWIVSVIRETST